MPILGGNSSILDRITEVFLRTLPQEIEHLDSSISKRNMDEVERFAHSIKSAAGSLGGKRVQQLAINLESASHRGELESCSNLCKVLEKEFGLLVEALENADWEKFSETYGA